MEHVFNAEFLKETPQIHSRSFRKRLRMADLKVLIEENKALKEKLTSHREEKETCMFTKPIDLSEYKTRKIYIDSMLTDAGWTEGRIGLMRWNFKACPTSLKWVMLTMFFMMIRQDRWQLSKPKRTCVDVSKGRQQAKALCGSS